MFNKLVEMYCGLGDTRSAKRVFEQMCEKNLDSWNLMLLGLAENGEGKDLCPDERSRSEAKWVYF